ncbi:MAG: hypothetical protein ABW049_13270 [Spongiibacteraceae bacterium]
MKPPVSKADLRRELDRQMRSYLNKGGEVHEIPRGVSGRDPADGPLPPTPLIAGEGRADRTYLTEVIAGIEARRKPNTPVTTRPRRPRKKLIYDDFGEPLRWMWEE